MTDQTPGSPQEPFSAPGDQTPPPPEIPPAPPQYQAPPASPYQTPASPYQTPPPGAPGGPAYGYGPYTPPKSGPETPLDQPYYGASFPIGVKRYWQKYATFTGRSSRSEFWWAYLANAIVILILEFALIIPGGAIAGNGGSGALIVVGIVLISLFVLAQIVPTYAILWRRLHDANVAGPFALLTLVPSLGGIWGLVIGFLPPNPLGSRFDAR